MIAIPVDITKPDTRSSKLFGNVQSFALYDPKTQNLSFVKNEGAGDGVKTAEFLYEQQVQRVFYSFMGNGPFNTLQKKNIDVFFLGKEPLPLDEIITTDGRGQFTEVTSENASTYLDPGTQTGDCQCGCS